MIFLLFLLYVWTIFFLHAKLQPGPRGWALGAPGLPLRADSFLSWRIARAVQQWFDRRAVRWMPRRLVAAVIQYIQQLNEPWVTNSSVFSFPDYQIICLICFYDAHNMGIMLDTDWCIGPQSNLSIFCLLGIISATRSEELRMINLSKDFNWFQCTFNWFSMMFLLNLSKFWGGFRLMPIYFQVRTDFCWNQSIYFLSGFPCNFWNPKEIYWFQSK